ncbi:hypothetical protein VdG1_08716 [Verticillium dahliae VDG1]|nr:hypothetical protein VdG1_08716 [Verticillium dahliae VDG1]
MPPPPDLTSYILPTQTSDDIFKSQILPAEFPSLAPAPQTQAGQRPLAVLIVGQTGAGKTRLAPAVLKAQTALRGSPAHIIADTYKTYHPSLPEAGSRGLPVRLTPIKVHDDSYSGLLDAAQWIDAHPETVDQVLVVRRGNLVAFSDAKERPDGKLMGQVAAAIVRERERPLTDVEKATAAEDLAKLEKRDTVQAQELRAMLAPLLAEPDPSSLQPLLPLEFPTERCGRDATLWLGDS